MKGRAVTHSERRTRANKSRQWGRDARADFVRELVAVMDMHRAGDGVCAVSLAAPELRLLPLFPTSVRVFPWCKPYAPHRPGVWPTYAWEPVIAWGRFPDREQQRTSKTPHDWFAMAPKVPDGTHETPKPEQFGDHVCDLTLGPRIGTVLELFAGTCPVSVAAAARGCICTAVDLDSYPVQPRLQMDVCEPPVRERPSKSLAPLAGGPGFEPDRTEGESC